MAQNRTDAGLFLTAEAKNCVLLSFNLKQYKGIHTNLHKQSRQSNIRIFVHRRKYSASYADWDF